MGENNAYSGKTVLLLFVSFLCLNLGLTWGFQAHRTINKLAIKSLPQPLYEFYATLSEYIEEHAVDPDKRRYIDTNEASKHYIDLEYYEQCLPIDTVPRFWKGALEKYGAPFLKNSGSLPWQIQRSMFRLKLAFQEGNVHQIAQISAELGHYVADAHVPLHTTANYDGQLTNQRGVHSLWETKIPDFLLDNYRLMVPKATLWYSEPDTIFTIISESHALINQILWAEKWVNYQIAEEDRYAFSVSTKNGSPIKNLSDTYLKLSNAAMDNSTELRFQQAIFRVASCWYTAWILAGQPYLISQKTHKKSLRKSALHSKQPYEVKFPLLTYSNYYHQSMGLTDSGYPTDSVIAHGTISVDCHPHK